MAEGEEEWMTLECAPVPSPPRCRYPWLAERCWSRNRRYARCSRRPRRRRCAAHRPRHRWLTRRDPRGGKLGIIGVSSATGTYVVGRCGPVVFSEAIRDRFTERLPSTPIRRVCSERDRWEVRISNTSAGAGVPRGNGSGRKCWRCRQSPDRLEINLGKRQNLREGDMRTGDGKEEEVRRGARASPRISRTNHTGNSPIETLI